MRAYLSTLLRCFVPAVLPSLTAVLCVATASAQSYGTDYAVTDGLRVTIGAAAVTVPKYEGSEETYLAAVPIFRLSSLSGTGAFGGVSRFEARGLDDLSYALFRSNGFELGPLAGYRLGRDDEDARRLRGLGDIDGGLVAGVFAKYGMGPFFVRGSLHHGLTGDDTGTVYRLGAGSRHRLSERLIVKSDLTLDIADDTYMRTYFGVSAVQSARSGLRVHETGAGAKSANVTLGAEYALTRDWTIHVSAGYTRLLGDAADSPIVEATDRLDGRLGLSYSFDWYPR